ncbi:non-ribosomal peptide synthetase [Flavobacterium soyae]|uniref:non-ribosomal peptide synthetase n=1 Tax=Flavobacterium soyae TaxID=2903098 RepID=UPI001E38438D|nr:condensation domain-containing protein [Flavobacterium soyae]MCD9574056.1 condensation domain-containing protein [Flavobacterium soyae]
MNSYKNWIFENQKAVNDLLDTELEYWLSQIDYSDKFEKNDGVGFRDIVKIKSGDHESNKDLQDKIITAFLFSFYDLTKAETCVIEREGHGRDSITNHDVSDVIGWFTCKYPIKYNIIKESLEETLSSVTATNKEVPNGGIGFEILKYYGPMYVSRQMESAPVILFNYLGNLSYKSSSQKSESRVDNNKLILSSHSTFSSAIEKTDQFSENKLNKIVFNAWVQEDILNCDFSISPELGFNQEMCHNFIEYFKNYLEKLVHKKQDNLKENITPFQKGLVGYALNYPDNKNYINQNSYESVENIPYDFFSQVCTIVTSKYEILRTCFTFNYDTGNFASMTLPAGTVTCEYFETENDSDSQELIKLLNEIKFKGFDIEKEPLIKFSLIKVKNNKSIIVITSHHIIIDATSISFILNELMQVSTELKLGKKPLINASSTVQFSTYVDWINSKDEKKGIDYWTNLLKNVEPSLLENKTVGETELKENEFSDLEYNFDINTISVRVLKKQNITLSAAFNFLTGLIFSKYNGTDSFVWGNTVTVRPLGQEDIESIVGPCITTIPVIVNFNSEKTILDAIKEVQFQVLESQEYAYLTFNDIVRNTGHQNLFSISYGFQNYIKFGMNQDEDNFNLTQVSHDSNISSHFPINIMFIEEKGGLKVKLRYRNDCFTSYLLNDITNGIVKVFNNLEKIKDQSLNNISIFEIAELKKASLDGLRYDLSNITLHGQFSEIAKKHPDNIAVIDLDQKCTYAELDKMSNSICNLLLKNSISGPVGINMKRSVNQIASIIGILKAGCHIVSIEKDFPKEKIEWINENIKLATILTDTELKVNLSAKLFVITKIDLVNAITLPVVDPDSLCCINYTSGSTGIPKLVKISHNGHVNRILWLKNNFPAVPDDIYGFKTLLCFGPSLREIFEPLMQGSSLFVYSDESNNNPVSFQELSLKNKVTRLFLTPTFIQLLYDCEMENALSSLQYLEISGEPISVELFRRLKSSFPTLKVVGRYGATEAPGTAYFTNENTDSQRILPLGKPIQNTNIKVFNEKKEELPLGIIGEIAISGASISTGYFHSNLEENTFMESEGIRYVKTGDLGLIDNEGKLILQGRKTRMVKVRGYRVEPGEIEYNLKLHPKIIKSIVVPVNDKNNIRLVAFYTQNKPLDQGELKSFLEKKIAHYMIPHEFVEITKIPLTDSGKINYTELTKSINLNTGTSLMEPDTETEKIIFNIIQEIIPYKEFDIQSNFFDIGLDSILALKAIHKIKKMFDAQILASDIYKNPCIKDLSLFINEQLKSDFNLHENNFYCINYKEQNDFLFFVPPIGYNTLNFKILEEIIPENVSLVVFNSVTVDDAVNTTVENIASNYIHSIDTFNFLKKINVCGWSLGGTIAYEMASQLEKRNDKLNSVILFDPGFYTPSYDENLTEEKRKELIKRLLSKQTDKSEDLNKSSKSAQLLISEIEQNVVSGMVNANKLVMNYKPANYTGNITLVKPSQIGADERNYNKQFNDLDKYCSGNISLAIVEGNHMNMINNNLDVIKTIITKDLFHNKEKLTGILK